MLRRWRGRRCLKRTCKPSSRRGSRLANCHVTAGFLLTLNEYQAHAHEEDSEQYAHAVRVHPDGVKLWAFAEKDVAPLFQKANSTRLSLVLELGTRTGTGALHLHAALTAASPLKPFLELDVDDLRLFGRLPDARPVIGGGLRQRGLVAP